MSDRLLDQRRSHGLPGETRDFREVDQRAARVDPFADPSSELELPDLGPDASLRWAALFKSDGTPDHRVIDRYLRLGWRPVRPSELPPGYFARTINMDNLQLGDCVCRGELTLMIEHRAFTVERRKRKEENVRSQLRSAGQIQGVPEKEHYTEDRGSGVQYGRR